MQTPKFLSVEEVLKLHQDQIDSFGGTPGVRDRRLLEAALTQPQIRLGGKLLHPRIYEQAAAYLYHLAMSYPFVDGNKRTAFAVMDTFIRLHGCSLDLTNDQAYELVMQLVKGKLSQDRLITYLEKAIVDVVLYQRF